MVSPSFSPGNLGHGEQCVPKGKIEMSSVTLYKALVGAGASEQMAINAAYEVVTLDRLAQLTTRADIADVRGGMESMEHRIKADVKADISGLETRVVRLILYYGFLLVNLNLAGASLLL